MRTNKTFVLLYLGIPKTITVSRSSIIKFRGIQKQSQFEMIIYEWISFNDVLLYFTFTLIGFDVHPFRNNGDFFFFLRISCTDIKGILNIYMLR